MKVLHSILQIFEKILLYWRNRFPMGHFLRQAVSLWSPSTVYQLFRSVYEHPSLEKIESLNVIRRISIAWFLTCACCVFFGSYLTSQMCLFFLFLKDDSNNVYMGIFVSTVLDLAWHIIYAQQPYICQANNI